MQTAKVDAQADLSLCLAHMSFCWFCHTIAQMSKIPLTKTSGQEAPLSKQGTDNPV